MNRKIVVSFLIVFSLMVAAGFGPKIAMAGYSGSHECMVPYNIKASDWWTGLHISTYYTSETLTIAFWHDGTMYATETLSLTNGEWTGNVQDLLSDPSQFQSPTVLIFSSTNGAFTVTQFVTNTGSHNPGFSHQTIFSYPNHWPY